MESSNYQVISKGVMITGLKGQLSTIKELLHIFRHLIECSQSIVMAYNPYNFLFLVVLAMLWVIYSNT